MTPPKLPADAPVLDVLQPPVVDLLKPVRHNLDVTTTHSLHMVQHVLHHAVTVPAAAVRRHVDCCQWEYMLIAAAGKIW